MRLLAQVPPELGVEVTPGNLEQVLDNLIANALDVSPSGGQILLEGSR